jgi:hypothetical protein
MFRNLLIACLTAGSLAVTAVAQDAKKDEKEETVRSKLSAGQKCCCDAVTVNFTKELGVPLEYLGTLGQRIYLARTKPDPVELAMAAQSLAVAEKVSGKKAPVTSDMVLKEALDLAKMRGVSSELTALALIVPDEATRKDLDQPIALAKKREEDEKARVKSGEESRDIHGTLEVTNHTRECLRIYVDGCYVGTVHVGRRAQFQVCAHGYTNHLDAYCEGGCLIRHAHVVGHRRFVRWHIDP